MTHSCPRRAEIGRADGEDEYLPERGLVGQPAGCTFCGSLPPDTFMDWIRRGGVVHGTDKSYKAYIEPPAGESGGEAKFYYKHLSPEQREEFIELFNSKQMKLTESGLYVLPFFCSWTTESEDADR